MGDATAGQENLRSFEASGNLQAKRCYERFFSHNNNNNNNNNNNIFIFFRQGTLQLHRYLSTMFAVPLLLRKINNVTLFIPISGRKRDTREAV